MSNRNRKSDKYQRGTNGYEVISRPADAPQSENRTPAATPVNPAAQPAAPASQTVNSAPQPTTLNIQQPANTITFPTSREDIPDLTTLSTKYGGLYLVVLHECGAPGSAPIRIEDVLSFWFELPEDERLQYNVLNLPRYVYPFDPKTGQFYSELSPADLYAKAAIAEQNALIVDYLTQLGIPVPTQQPTQPIAPSSQPAPAPAPQAIPPQPEQPATPVVPEDGEPEEDYAPETDPSEEDYASEDDPSEDDGSAEEEQPATLSAYLSFISGCLSSMTDKEQREAFFELFEPMPSKMRHEALSALLDSMSNEELTHSFYRLPTKKRDRSIDCAIKAKRKRVDEAKSQPASNSQGASSPAARPAQSKASQPTGSERPSSNRETLKENIRSQWEQSTAARRPAAPAPSAPPATQLEQPAQPKEQSAPQAPAAQPPKAALDQAPAPQPTPIPVPQPTPAPVQNPQFAAHQRLLQASLRSRKW